MNHRSERSRQGYVLAALLFLLVAASIWLFTQRYWWLTPLASVHGSAVDRVFYITLAITGVLFIVLQAGLGLLVAKFGNRGGDTPRAVPKPYVERRFALAAGLLILSVDITLFALGESQWFKVWGPAPAGASIVEVTASQFMWHFRYPGPDGVFGKRSPLLVDPDNPVGLDMEDPAAKDDLVISNELHLVKDQPVVLKLHSRDVIHSFYLPNLRVKQDVVPGMEIQVWFVPNEAGRFEIACNQLCGMFHHRMRGFLTIESNEEFTNWIAERVEEGQ